MRRTQWKVFLLIGSLWWISGAPTTRPAIADQEIAEELILFAIEPWRSKDSSIGLIRWPVQPSVTLYFLAEDMSAEEAAAIEYLDDFRQKCVCISAVRVVKRGGKIERRPNDIPILIDKNGFANFLDQVPDEITSAFGTASELNETFPRTLSKTRSTTDASFRFLADRKYVYAATVVISVNEKLEGLRGILGHTLLAGLNPGLSQSTDMIPRYVQQVATSEGEMKVPTSQAFDLLRHLFSSKVAPGMLPEDIRLIDW